MNKLIEYFARHKLLSDLLIVFVFVVGLATAFLIRREAFPNITYDLLTVTTIYPGASPEEVEKFVTNPLEQELKELSGVKRLSSVSVESRSLLVLLLDPDQTTDVEALNDAKNIIDRVSTLPADAEDPIAASIKSDITPIVEVAISGIESESELRSQAKLLEDQFTEISGVARIEFKGLRDLEIQVEANPIKLRENQISLNELINALKKHNISIPGGSYIPSVSDKEMILRTVGEFADINDVANTVIRSNALAQTVRIKDVATVTSSFTKASNFYRSSSRPSISLVVFKKQQADAVDLVNLIKSKVDDFKPNMDQRIRVDYVNDMSYYIERRLSVLSSNMVIGLALVLFFLSIILPWRIALVTSIGIPFAFFGTMIYFNQTGISLNLLSMMGLIIVVGMLVDDAIVVTENAQRYMEKGLSPLEASIKGTQQIWLPVTASVFTTIVAFAPLMSMSGIMGKFVAFIPLGVVIALLFSLFECFFILPHHLGKWVRPKDVEGKKGGMISTFWDQKLAPAYETTVQFVLRKRYWVLLGTTFLMVFTGFLARQMNFVLFPNDGIESFSINIETPLGTQLEMTSEYMKPIEAAVSKLPSVEMKSYITKVGVQESGPNDPSSRRGGEYGQVHVYLTPVTERKRDASEIIDQLREEIGVPKGIKEIRFAMAQGGPPVGKPISIGVRSDNYEEILKVVKELKAFLKTIEGVKDIEDNFVLGKKEIRVEVNPAEAAAGGLSISEVGQTVRAAYEGIVATTIRSLDEEVDVRVSLTHKDRNSREALLGLQIPNLRGNLVPLSSLAKLKEGQGIASYEHEDHRRQVRVTGDLDEGLTSSTEISKKVREKWIPEMQKKYPNVAYNFGGEDQDTRESMESLKRAFLLAVFGIFMILVLAFGNIYQPLLVITTIPLGIMSVIWSFYVHSKPLTFLGMLGVVALAGVIVNNAIVFVSFANELRAEGMEAMESIKEAAKTRLRPIFLTTLTTVAGILPTAYGIGGLDPFVVPIALGLGWGVLFGAVLTTLIFPAIMAVQDDFINLFRRFKS